MKTIHVGVSDFGIPIKTLSRYCDKYKQNSQIFNNSIGYTKARQVFSIAEEEEELLYIIIYTHCSHKLQPLGRTVFGPFKKYLNFAGNWIINNPGKTMTIYDIPTTVLKLIFFL